MTGPSFITTARHLSPQPVIYHHSPSSITTARHHDGPIIYHHSPSCTNTAHRDDDLTGLRYITDLWRWRRRCVPWEDGSVARARSDQFWSASTIQQDTGSWPCDTRQRQSRPLVKEEWTVNHSVSNHPMG